MNEEQKAFIDNLVKNNIDHRDMSRDSDAEGLRVPLPVHGLRFGSKKPVKNVNYKGEEKTVDDLMEIVNPKNNLKSEIVNEVRRILTLIVNDDRYDYYNTWIKRKGMKSSVSKENTYSNRLFNIVKDLIEDDETKLLQEDYRVAHKVKEDKNHDPFRLEKSSNIESNENDQYFDETNDINLNEIDEKSNKPDDEKTIEIDQNLPDELSLNNADLSTEVPIEAVEALDDKSSSDNEEEKIKFESAPVLKNKDKTADIIPKSPIIEKGEKKEPTYPIKSFNDNYDKEGPNEDQLFKNIELALSYKDNPEYMEKTILEFKGQNGHVEKYWKPSDKLRRLVHQQIAEYMKALHKAYKSNISDYITRKKEIIDKINERYFRDNNNNEFGWKVYGKSGDNKRFEIKDLESGKLKRRAHKQYINQDSPNKFTFFVYNMRDIYSIIEEYYEINLSVNSKHLIESIVHTSIDSYIKSAKKSGQVSYHTFRYRHGINEDVIKLIEKYINSKRNIHIKMKFEFDSDSRSKLMEIISREIDRNKNDYEQKSKNIMSFIDS